MNKFFILVAGLIFTPLLLTGSTAKALEGVKCEAGCENAHAPGTGRGKSICWVTFVAPKDGKDLQVQIFDTGNKGLLKNKEGQIAIRGGEGTNRVSVDCAQLRHSAKVIFCAKFDDKDRSKTFNGESLRLIIERLPKKGGQDIKI